MDLSPINCSIFTMGPHPSPSPCLRIVLIQPFYHRFMRSLGGQRDPGLMLGGVGSSSVGYGAVSGDSKGGSGGLHGTNLRLDGAILNLKGVIQGVRMSSGGAGRGLQTVSGITVPNPLSVDVKRRRALGRLRGGSSLGESEAAAELLLVTAGSGQLPHLCRWQTPQGVDSRSRWKVWIRWKVLTNARWHTWTSIRR